MAQEISEQEKLEREIVEKRDNLYKRYKGIVKDIDILKKKLVKELHHIQDMEIPHLEIEKDIQDRINICIDIDFLLRILAEFVVRKDVILKTDRAYDISCGISEAQYQLMEIMRKYFR